MNCRMYFCVAAAWGIIVMPLLSSAQTAYEIIDLGTLGGTESEASGINESGQVVGYSFTANFGTHAFLWENRVMTDLGTLTGVGASTARGINDAGQVVGNSGGQAFLWENGGMTGLGGLPFGAHEAYDINNVGQVLVQSLFIIPGAGGAEHPFLWENGAGVDLGAPLGPSWAWWINPAYGYGVNNAGQAVGLATYWVGTAGIGRATLWSNGAITDLGGLSVQNFQIGEICDANDDCTPIFAALPGFSKANQINDGGQVVGQALLSFSEGWRAFIWQNGVMTDVGTLLGPAAPTYIESNTIEAFDINNRGQVVGISPAIGGAAHAFLWEGGVMRDLNDLIDPNSGWVLNSAAAINEKGAIVGDGLHNGQPRAFLLLPPRRPVLIIPGVGATYAADVNDIGLWMFTRGIHPTGLQIDPLAHAYDDLIQTLKNVGYVEGKDLFVVNYDWRVPPGPSDGVFDGVVGGLTAASITDQSFEYAVDYLGYYLRKAMDAWETDHPGTTLDKVNLIAHSTGGLVARTYIQSAAYGGTFDGIRTLPVVDNLMMIGVPNRGASKAWNPLHDNWGVDIAFQIVLSKILNMGYQKVLAGAIITGPDLDISLASLIPPACQDLPEICFIQQFNPTTRSLLATYDFIDFGNGFTNVNSNPFVRNDLVLDLNAGLDLALNGDPNAFADKATVTVIYATNVDTPTSVVEKVGSVGGTNAIMPFSDFGARDAQPGEVWYDDIVAPVSGDGTVPLDSSAGQFVGDARVTLKPFAKGTNTSEDVSHLGLMYNLDVQKDILGILGASFVDADISTTLHSAIASSMSTALNVVPNIIGGSILGAILDPVEGFVVDGQGRRLGYTALTGPITEIPGSIWFGNSDGMGWVLEPLVGPVELQLSGLGGSYYVLASVISPGGSSGLIDQGVLEAGASRVLPVPLIRNLLDLAVFQNCFGDSPAAGSCLVFDIDGNHSIDLQDFRSFLAAMTGP